VCSLTRNIVGWIAKVPYKDEEDETRSESPAPAPTSSARRLAANRANAKRSTGPKTARGKAEARRNALRHGLAAVSLLNAAVSKQIEVIANAICGPDAPPLLREQALAIAENEVMVLQVRAARIRATERMRTVEPTPLAHNLQFPSDQDLIYALDQLQRGKPAAVIRLCRRATRALLTRQKMFEAAAAATADGTGEQAPAATPKGTDCAAGETARDPEPAVIRDEVDAFCRALPELNKLERYECRALSRRKGAIRKFDALKSQMSGWIKDTE